MTDESHPGELCQSLESRDDPKQRINDWLQSWEDGTLGSLEDKEPDPFLVAHFEDVSKGRQNMKILVPMCGTCIDMKWFADQGHCVVGVDVSEIAARLFFQQHNIPYVIQDVPDLQGKLYKSKGINIKFYVADFFIFNESMEGCFDVVWDTGALGSIDINDRSRYMSAMRCLLKNTCLYLLEILVYDRGKFKGPPYCFYEEDIQQIFGNEFTVVKVAEHDYDVPEEDASIGEDINEIGFRFHFYTISRS